MEIDPPIWARTSEQLIEILEEKDGWLPEVVDQAKTELHKRGISLQIPELRKINKHKFRSRVAAIKARATYTQIEKLLIVLLGPLLMLLFRDFLMFHPGEGYKIKNRQGLFYSLVGITLWVFILYLYLRFENRV